MAEKKVAKSVEKEVKVTEKAVVAPVVENDSVAEEARRKQTIIWIAVAGIVLIVILGILLLVTLAHQYIDQYNNGMNDNGYSRMQPAFRDRGLGGWSQAQITTSSSSTNGPTTTTTETTYTLTQGVVTNVDDSSLTIAGNGKSQKVTTNSSTVYVDDQKPAVNDSVAVWGTSDSNGNITATKVEVLNN